MMTPQTNYRDSFFSIHLIIMLYMYMYNVSAQYCIGTSAKVHVHVDESNTCTTTCIHNEHY